MSSCFVTIRRSSQCILVIPVSNNESLNGFYIFQGQAQKFHVEIEIRWKHGSSGHFLCCLLYSVSHGAFINAKRDRLKHLEMW